MDGVPAADEAMARADESSGPVAAAGSWVRGHRADLEAYLTALVRIPTDHPWADFSGAADRVEAELTSLGLMIERYEVAQAEGSRLPTILGWLGTRTMAPALVLNAHLDTSPPSEDWTVSPYGAEARDGRIYGRGATLSKGDVAAYGYAIGAARAVLGADPGATAVLAITADEGSGGDLGPRYLLDQFGLRPRYAITAGFTHRVGIAHNGVVQARLTVRSEAAHQAVVRPEREAMRQAVEAAHRLLAAGDRLASRSGGIAGIPCPTLNITAIAGGGPFGMAPATVELFVDRRVTPDESTAEALAELRDLVRSIGNATRAEIDLAVVQVAEPLRPTTAQRPLAELVRDEASAVQGRRVPLRGLPLYTDARWFGARGIPTVLYGAGAEDLIEAGINGRDENVHLSDLHRASEAVARVVTRLLAELCQAADTAVPEPVEATGGGGVDGRAFGLVRDP